jgi:hypothetical protein
MKKTTFKNQNKLCRNRKIIPVVLAGVFSYASQLSVPLAYADTDNLHLPARMQPGSAQGTFTRMFPELPPFAEATDGNRELAKKLGQSGGLMDALDVLTDPVALIVDPNLSLNNPDNPDMTAGVTFLGQFLDHDITLDPKSDILKQSNPKTTTNFRTPAFDLDSVYGAGPTNSPELYEMSSGDNLFKRGDILFKIEAIPGSEAVSRKGATRYDLPRDENGNAIVAESRNDENLIISQLHLAMLRFHNAVTARVRAAHADWPADQVFEKARRQVRWHYQWIIVHEFLPLTIGQKRVSAFLNDRSTSQNQNPRIPIEFSVAAYRFGHSQIRPSYRANFGPDAGPALFAFVFDDSIDPNDADPNDMRGGKRAPRRFVDWQTFFKFDETNFRPNKRIDSKLSSPILDLPGSRGPAPGLPSDGVTSLASRNLMRHVNFGLPSGQAIAAKLGLTALTPAQLSELKSYGWDTSTPLWFYILKEAEVKENGLRLGPVGGYIVGKVFIDLLRADKSSYVAAQPNWKPELPSATSGDFRMTDLLTFAGVVPPLN